MINQVVLSSEKHLFHMCMETMLGISLCSYLYLNEAKMLSFSLSLQHFSSTKLEKRAEQVLPGSEDAGGGGRRERWPRQCIHI
jgi:hypothetical protein